MLAIVLGRLADPLAGMNDKLFAKESRSSREEVRKREGASGWEVMMPALLPPGAPARARLGRARRDAAAVARGDPRFAEVFYRPERMTLVISGPVPVELEKVLAAKLPPAWQGPRGGAARTDPPPGDCVRRARAPPRPTLPTHKSIAVVVPELWMAWRVPPASGIAASRLEVVARVVGRMLSRRLDPGRDQRRAGRRRVGLCPAACRAPSSAASSFAPRTTPCGSANETRGALEALSDVTLIHINPRLRCELQRRGHRRRSCEPPSAWTASASGRRPRRRWSTSNRGRRTPQVIDALAKITVDDVADFAGRYLKPDAARAVLLLPEEVRNVTHGQSRWKKEERGRRISADREPDPEAESDPDAERRRGDSGRRTDASARTGACASPRLRRASPTCKRRS